MDGFNETGVGDQSSQLNYTEANIEQQPVITPEEAARKKQMNENALMALVLGWGTDEAEKPIRNMVKEAYGEEFVQEYERSNGINKELIAGRLLKRATELEGETDEDYLVRLSRENNKSYADCYGDVGEVWRDAKEKLLPEMHTRWQKLNETQAAIENYVLGRAYEEDGLDAAEMAETLAQIDPEKRAKLEAARLFGEQYLEPLRQRVKDKESAMWVLKDLDNLDEEVFNFIGDDPERAQMLVHQLGAFAKQIQDAGIVGVTDEFAVAIGKKLANLSHLGQIYPEILIRNKSGNVTRIIDANRMDEITYNEVAEAEQSGDYTVEHYASREDRLAPARGHLRNAVNEATRITGSYWNPYNWLRTASSMFGDTALYLTPGGMVTGTAEMIIGGQQEIYNRLRAEGYSDLEARNQAFIEAPIEAAVELLPFGVGGKWLSEITEKAIKSGKPGAISKWIARQTQTSAWKAMTAEMVAGAVEEGVGEPIAGGVLKWTAEQAADALGIPHAESTPFMECFSELTELTNPSHVAGLLIFTGGLVGVHARGFRQRAAYYRENRELVGLTGLSEGAINKVMDATPEQQPQLAQELLKKEWEQDPEGMKQRVLERNTEAVQQGVTLPLTGVVPEGWGGEALRKNKQAAAAFQRAYNERVQKGLVPQVEELENGNIQITDRNEAGEITFQKEMTPGAADIYLYQRFQEADETEYKRRLEALGAARMAKESAPDIRAEIAEEAAVEGGKAIAEEINRTAEQTGIRVEDALEGLPEQLAEPIRKRGYFTAEDVRHIGQLAQGQVTALADGGMSLEDARRSYFEEVGRGRTLGDWVAFAEQFAATEKVAGIEEGQGIASVYSARRSKIIDGKQVYDHALYTVSTGADAYAMLEDVTERVTAQIVEARAENLMKDGTHATRQEAEAAAWEEMGRQVARARAEVMKRDPEANVPEVDGENPRSIIEALSSMATSNFIGSRYVPEWLSSMAELMKGNVSVVDDMLKIRAAVESALANNKDLGDFADLLERIGARVQSVFGQARIDATARVDQQTAAAAEDARARASESYVPSAEIIREQSAEEQAEIQEAEEINQRAAEVEREDQPTPAEDMERVKDNFEGVAQGSNAPENMRGVFVGDQCLYDSVGKYYIGFIDKNKIKDGTEQVKVGERGAHGVIKGRELTGKYQRGTAPLYIWRRKNGELWLISGRHRFELSMRDDNIQELNCYVYEEDAEHNEKWARLLDYENNMRDDQADELTAAIYARETGYSDKILKEKGLLRNKSKSKLGIRIGRGARKDLWERFQSGMISAEDAGEVVALTEFLTDEAKIEEIQARTVLSLEKGWSWEKITGMAQVIAFGKSSKMKQGTLMFGEDWAASQERMATYLEKSIQRIKENIALVKSSKKQTGKARKEAERLGIYTETTKDSTKLLNDLNLLLAQYQNAGLHPEIMADAEMWDGETEVDPIARGLRKADEQRQQEEEEKEMTQEEYLEKQAGMADMFATFAMRDASQAPRKTVWEILDSRPESVKLQKVKKELVKLIDQLETAGGGKAGRLGTGAQSLANFISLISATRNNLPERYKVKGLTAIMAWATFYADMIQTGRATPETEIPSGRYFRQVAGRVRGWANRMEMKGIEEEDIEKAVADHVGKKMDKLFAAAAKQCVQRINEFEKDRAREAIDLIKERALPKRESGKHYPRGKMSADDYKKLVVKAYGLLDIHGEELERRTQQLSEKIMKLDSLPDTPENAEERAELSEDIGLERLFLGWERMSVQQAIQAAAAFEDMARTGRKAWEEILEDRAAAARYKMEQMRKRKGWKKSGEAKSDIAEERAKKQGRISTIFFSFMSLGQKMRALAGTLGEGFTYDQMRKMAQMNLETRRRQNELNEWLYGTLAKYSGLKSELKIRDWLLKNNELIDTGKTIEKKKKAIIRLSFEEAREWLSLTPEEREAKREKMRAAAEKNKRDIKLPSEEQLDTARAALEQYERAKAWADRWDKADELERKDMRAEIERELVMSLNGKTDSPEVRNNIKKSVSERIKANLGMSRRESIEGIEEITEKQQLVISKLGALQNILILEQEWYKGVAEANGITPEIRQYLYELVGPELLSLGYAMRDKLAEAREELSEIAERITGIPFPSHEKYFPAGGGVFLHGGSADRVAEKIQSGDLPGLPPFLIPREATAPELSWSVSAIDQFVQAAQAQNNFCVTAEWIQEWKSLFGNKEFSMELEANLGAEVCGLIKKDLRVYANAAVADALASIAARNLIGRFISRYAILKLAGNVGTILKNFIGAGANAAAVNKGVRVILDKAGNVQEITEQTLSRAKLIAGLKGGAFTMEEIKSDPMIRERLQRDGATIARAAAEGAKGKGKSGKYAAGRVAEKTTQVMMGAIEYADVGGNLISCYAMANAVYAQISEQDTAGQLKHETKKQIALDSVRIMLDQGAQPLNVTQKGTIVVDRGALGMLGSAIFLFKSEALAKVGYWASELMSARGKGIEGWSRAAWNVGSSMAIMGGSMAAIATAIAWLHGKLLGDDDDALDSAEKILTQFSMEAAKSIAGDVPFLGDALQFAVSRIAGERMYTSHAGTDTPIINLYYAAERVVKEQKKDGQLNKDVAAYVGLLHAAALSLGAFAGGAGYSTISEIAAAAGAAGNVVKFGANTINRGENKKNSKK